MEKKNTKFAPMQKKYLIIFSFLYGALGISIFNFFVFGMTYNQAMLLVTISTIMNLTIIVRAIECRAVNLITGLPSVILFSLLMISFAPRTDKLVLVNGIIENYKYIDWNARFEFINMGKTIYQDDTWTMHIYDLKPGDDFYALTGKIAIFSKLNDVPEMQEKLIDYTDEKDFSVLVKLTGKDDLEWVIEKGDLKTEIMDYSKILYPDRVWR